MKALVKKYAKPGLWLEEVPEPEFLCGLIRKVVGTVAVGEKSGSPERAATFRDIAILYRSDTGGEVLSSYRDALNRAGIPHVVPSRKGFFARQEIQDLLYLETHQGASSIPQVMVHLYTSSYETP